MSRESSLRRRALTRAAIILMGLPALVAWAAGPKPRIAIVIDDFGLTYPKNVPDEWWMELPMAATYAVMPKSPRTRAAAKAAREAGKEVILHMPLDPFLDLELPPDHIAEEDVGKVRNLLDNAIAEIPGAVGLNNHRSLEATRNRPLMRWLMGELKAKGLYFLDSRVSAKTVAYEEARKASVAAAINDTFLDEARRHDKPFCVRMLRRAASVARRKGFAVAIGHHYFRGTYECLRDMVPKLEQEGFEFVFASQIAR